MDGCGETVSADDWLFHPADDHEYVWRRFAVRIWVAKVRSANTHTGKYAEMESSA
jgi:hypothetical protein